MNTPDLKFLSLVQTNPSDFNNEQKLKRDEFKKTHGSVELHKLLNSEFHNDIKKDRTTDYRLNETELNLLKNNKILMKSGKNNSKSFGEHLIDLYQNDMPVFITSDMMLYALHRFYDETMEKIELGLINDFKKLCENLLNTVKQINLDNLSTYQIEQIKGLELYLLVPYFLLHYETVKTKRDWMYISGKTKGAETFVIPTVQPFLNDPAEIKKITDSIRKNNISNCTINGVNFSFNSGCFKPRGHYENTTELQSYFMAFTWFSKCIVKLNPSNREEYANNFMFSTLLTFISQKSIEQVNKIESFVKKLIGNPDGYTLTSFLKNIDDCIKQCTNGKFRDDYDLLKKSSSFDAKLFFGLIEEINNNTILTQKCKLTKFGDSGLNLDESILTEYCFSLIGKGTTLDNNLINDVVDVNFAKNTGFSRKFPSIFDITYGIFNNSSTIDFVNDRITNPKMENRDGIQYVEYLESLKTKYDNEFSNMSEITLYEQELIMLRALSKYPNIQPFNSRAWGYKQAQTQIGHYNEMRHDNVLYLDECNGCMLLCKYEDIMVEPCVEFWQEYLKLVITMESLFNSVQFQKHQFDFTDSIFENFKNIINKILEFLEYVMNDQQVPENLKKELTCILERRYCGSGQITYTGWYSELFYSNENSVVNKHEVSSYFTAPDDDRGVGGICHLGNGDVQLMYIVFNNSVYIGPVYKVYDVVTPSNVRYNDAEWAQEKNKFESLNFNLK